ncbi:hypothetical protein FVA95_22360 [Pseudonocardia sp. EV170527-09]|uniref:hypothetical protein n=1 Tax=Pseudonocardia sp. EV170527-09 TaxID=2603411 RepID=UPI0011F39622|nr:hypothetical protein [Pseudonocardia sp. EV170527-09]KAA1019570.1 hypothetical protein FVA95_22360 [Pseudonocardia sp. EV170527-09]
MSTELQYDEPAGWRLHVSVEALAHVACEVAGLLPEGVHAQAVGTQISIWSNRGAGSPRVVEMKDLGVPGDPVTATDIPTETVLRALDAIQEMVMDHLHQSWPVVSGTSSGLHPQAQRDGDQVAIGYVDRSGAGLQLTPFPVPPEPE